MLGNYSDKKPIHSLNNDGVNLETHRDPDELTFLTFKVGFAGIIIILTISLALICIMALT
jgi:hypothetical protein